MSPTTAFFGNNAYKLNSWFIFIIHHHNRAFRYPSPTQFFPLDLSYQVLSEPVYHDFFIFNHIFNPNYIHNSSDHLSQVRGLVYWGIWADFFAISGNIFVIKSNFSRVFTRRTFFINMRLNLSCDLSNASFISFSISSTSAIASLLSDVYGIFVDATCVRKIAGPIGIPVPWGLIQAVSTPVNWCNRCGNCTITLLKIVMEYDLRTLEFSLIYLWKISPVDNPYFYLEGVSWKHGSRSRGSKNKFWWDFLSLTFKTPTN